MRALQCLGMNSLVLTGLLFLAAQVSAKGAADGTVTAGGQPEAERRAASVQTTGISPARDTRNHRSHTSLAQESGKLRVSNFVFGSICRRDEQGRVVSEQIDVHATGDICESSRIQVRGRGRCVYAGEEQRCTWYGFEFHYANKDPNEPITCTWTRSVTADEGNTDEVVARGVTSGTTELDTGADTEGHLRHPMYVVYRPFPAPWHVAEMTLSCTYLEEEVLATKWTLLFSSAFR